ncbi:hypothetical protein [Paenibacillus protaetiae]|uniref:hypothetical protein n=1 Tax=Paenibacillus protaetiae TaxID=2509456 RepID=UPI0013EC0C37|nr:hypothetical protein [Paenibacillus protaetiae]
MDERIAEWSAFYAEQWLHAARNASANLQGELASFVEGKLALLSDGADKEQMAKLYEQMIHLKKITIDE